VTIEELYSLVGDILGKPNHPVEFRDWVPGDIKVFDIDNDKIKNELGLEFMTDFRLGLGQTVIWAKAYLTSKDGFGV
jgi:nucleoside-diphosphate-sugar epimerase